VATQLPTVIIAVVAEAAADPVNLKVNPVVFSVKPPTGVTIGMPVTERRYAVPSVEVS
jgi:hypothetical protein